jgi:hypothetical protein
MDEVGKIEIEIRLAFRAKPVAMTLRERDVRTPKSAAQMPEVRKWQ